MPELRKAHLASEGVVLTRLKLLQLRHGAWATVSWPDPRRAVVEHAMFSATVEVAAGEVVVRGEPSNFVARAFWPEAERRLRKELEALCRR